MKQGKLWVLLLLIGTGLAQPSPAVAGVGDGWSAPVALSDPELAEKAWFPDLAIGPDGSVHVVWCSFPKVERGTKLVNVDALVYAVYKGGSWSPSNVIYAHARTNLDENTVRSGLAMGRDGRLHVLLRDELQHLYSSAPWNEAWTARAWDAGQSLGTGYYNALAADSRGHLHAVMSGTIIEDPGRFDAECPGCSDLFYRRSEDGGRTWSQRVFLSRLAGGDERQQIKVDHQDSIHVVWDHGMDSFATQGRPTYGLYRRSDDGGDTWSATYTFGVANEAVYQTTLGVADTGRLMVVYRGARTTQVYFQVSSDGGETWSQPAPIPTVRARSDGTPYDAYSLVADSTGQLHLLMAGTLAVASDSRIMLLHVTWDGSAWSEPAIIMQGPLLPEWPRAAIANGNELHVVWFTRGTDFRVWYSNRHLGTPDIEPLPLFTPAPTPALMATQALAPRATPTALPPDARRAPLLNEGERLVVARGGVASSVLAALVPAGLLLAALVGLAVRRRQR